MSLILGRGLSPVRRSPMAASLRNVLASCVMDIDATKGASYGGAGQSWTNLVTTPADGQPAGAYHFMLGANAGIATDDPTFAGNANMSGAYFLLDGGDMFRIGANTPFIKALGKTGSGTDFWMAPAFRFQTSATSYTLCSNQLNSVSAGIRLLALGTNRLQLVQGGDATQSVTPSDARLTMTHDTDYLVIVSRQADGAVTRFWCNSLAKVELAQAYAAGTADASATMTLGAGGAGTSNVPNNTRIYSFAMGREFIDNAEAALLFAAYNARHGRVYA